MSDYKFMLISDSTNDLPKVWYEENNACCVPHGIVIDGKEYWDDFGVTLPPKKVYDYIRGGGMPLHKFRSAWMKRPGTANPCRLCSFLQSTR